MVLLNKNRRLKLANQFILSHFVPVVAMKAFFLVLGLAISHAALASALAWVGAATVKNEITDS